MIAEDIKVKLNNAGFGVVNTYDGREAIESLRKEKFDFIITDLNMPNINGFGVLEYLQNSNIKTPVIVHSTLIRDEIKKQAKGLGALDYFVKSNNSIDEVVDYISSVIK